MTEKVDGICIGLTDHGTIRIGLEEPVRVIELTLDEATELAQKLLNKIVETRMGRAKPDA